jgi:hypothetical protein
MMSLFTEGVNSKGASPRDTMPFGYIYIYIYIYIWSIPSMRINHPIKCPLCYVAHILCLWNPFHRGLRSSWSWTSWSKYMLPAAWLTVAAHDHSLSLRRPSDMPPRGERSPWPCHCCITGVRQHPRQSLDTHAHRPSVALISAWLASSCFPVPHTLTNKITLQTHIYLHI